MAREVLDTAGKAVKVGITTDELDKIGFLILFSNVIASP